MWLDSRMMTWQVAAPEERREKAAISFLSIVDYWNEKLEQAEDALANCRATKYSPRGGWQTGLRGGGRHGGLENKIAKEESLIQMVEKFRKNRDDALQMVNDSLDGIQTPKVGEALRLVYLEHMTAPQAGKVLGVTDRQIRRLKAKGYEELKLPMEWEHYLAA